MKKKLMFALVLGAVLVGSFAVYANATTIQPNCIPYTGSVCIPDPM